MQISILLDTYNYITKPTNKDNIKINNNLNNNPVTIELSELVNYIEKGCSYNLSTFKGNLHNDTWQSQQLFGLDFDNNKQKITISEVNERLLNFGLGCNIIYPTFSSDETNNKFRVLIYLNELITDKTLRDNIQLALYDLFPEADTACKNASRLYYGTNRKCIYLNEQYTAQYSDIVSAAYLYAMSVSSNPVRTMKKCQKSTVHYISKYNDPETNDSFDSNFLMKEEFDWELARSRIEILKRLLRGDWLYHQQLFGLATNMYYLRGGQKLFKDSLDKCGLYSKDKYQIMTYVKHYNYYPQRLSNFSPYTEDHYFKNIYRSVVLENNKPMKVEDTLLIELEEAEIKFKELFEQTLNNKDKDITVFKLPTGFGKTESYLNLEGITVAAPTHKLINEIDARFKTDHLVTPELPKNLSETDKLKIQHLYRIGNYKAVKSYLTEIQNTNPEIIEYKKQLVNTLISNKTVITTIEKALCLDFNAATLIFDEDPLDNLLKIDTLFECDIKNLINEKINKADKIVLQSILNNFENLICGVVYETPKIQFKNLKLIYEILFKKYSKYKSNLLDFFKSNYFIRDNEDVTKFYFVTKRELPNKKIIIFSATANKFIYNHLYPKCNFIDLTNIKLKGTIEQDTKCSCSRTSLYSLVKNSKEDKQDTEDKKYKLEQLLSKIHPYPVLTFKQALDYFPNTVQDIYFGNCLGYDRLKGQNANIIGTPHCNPLVYSLYAKLLDIDYDTNDFITYKQLVRRNGFLFNFKTYHNKGLQEIQFYFIEKDLIQMVGRLRLLRYENTAFLFSNYPIEQATII